MRIALIGANGQLGRELRGRLNGSVVAFGHADLDICSPESIERGLSSAAAELVVNAAAYNQVDRAEDEPEFAFAVNALGPRNLARACEARGIRLLHASTDYVFSGREPERFSGRDAGGQHVESSAPQTSSLPGTLRAAPYRETDLPEPQNVYGVSKLAGEHFVGSLCRRHFIVRTSGLYGPTETPGTGNFVNTMLRLGRQRGEVEVVDDQTVAPTYTADVAGAIEALIAGDAYGVYHATNSGGTTWYEFAREIFRQADMDVTVRPIRSSRFGAKAQRPGYSVLDSGKLAATIGFALPLWEDALRRYLQARKE